MTGGVTVERPLVVFGPQANFDSSEVNNTFVFHVFSPVIYKARIYRAAVLQLWAATQNCVTDSREKQWQMQYHTNNIIMQS